MEQTELRCIKSKMRCFSNAAMLDRFLADDNFRAIVAHAKFNSVSNGPTFNLFYLFSKQNKKFYCSFIFLSFFLY